MTGFEEAGGFEELATSRRDWIDSVLIPWCRQASLSDLRKAATDWINIAGAVDPGSTLWVWAWGRFPALVHDGIAGLNETHEVRVQLVDETTLTGFPDNEQSRQEELVLLRRTETGFEHERPISIDEIRAVELVDPEAAVSAPDLPERTPTTLSPQLPDDQRI